MTSLNDAPSIQPAAVRTHKVSPKRRRWWTAALFVAALTPYLFTPSFGYLSWDDPVYVYENKGVTQPDGLKQIWTTLQMPAGATNWPLVFTTFWIEYRITDGDPWLFHLDNALLHALAAVLAFRMLTELGAGDRAALIAAFLFAVHPIQIESVAWITERKNVLSAVFFFASITSYVRFRNSNRTGTYVSAVVLYACALMSKSSVVALPLLWLLIDRFIIDGRWTMGAFRRAAVPVVLTVLAALQTLAVDKVPQRNLPIPQRPFVAAAALWFYLRQLIFPVDILPLYPRWYVDFKDPAWWVGLGGALGVAAVLFWKRRQISGLILWACCYYALLLLPVIGIAQFGYMRYTFVADHFVYLATLGPFLLIGMLYEYVCERLETGLRWFLRLSTSFAVLYLAFSTLVQTVVWSDAKTFWDYCSKVCPGTAADVKATSAFGRKDFEEVARLLRIVVEHRPYDVYAKTSLGQSLFRIGEKEEGIRILRSAALQAPHHFDAQFNLGRAYIEDGKPKSAVKPLLQALSIKPHAWDVQFLLAQAYLTSGQVAQAVEILTNALERNPSLGAAEVKLAQALTSTGRVSEAVNRLERFVARFPIYGPAWVELARLRGRTGGPRVGLQTLQTGYVESQGSAAVGWPLARLLATASEPSVLDPGQALRIVEEQFEKIDEYNRALRKKANYREEDERKATARQLDTASQVYALNGDFDNAVNRAREALESADASLAAEIRARLQEYKKTGSRE